MNNQFKIVKIELILAHLLRWGVLLTGIIILLGWTLGNNTLINSGLFILILLPILRVFISGIIFLFSKDSLYFIFCLYVLLTLSLSLFLGKII